MELEPVEATKGLRAGETQGEAESTSCSCFSVHPEKVEAACAQAIELGLLVELGELYKVFSDTTRLRILGALAGGELCVCDIGVVLGASQSAVSHQLSVLRAARLVAHRREGKTVYYRLADDHVGLLLKLGLEHASERAGKTGGERAFDGR
jgi:ArsR family transcriptional regulator, lead/cadmium/zinc/bismuth-responsive transcriptional repressor